MNTISFHCIEDYWNGTQTEGENFLLNIEGDLHTRNEGTAYGSSSSTWTEGKKTFAFSAEGDERCAKLTNTRTGISVTQHYKMLKTSKVVRMYNVIKNEGDAPISLINASSAMISFDPSGEMDWNDDERFRVYTVNSHWATEAQWKVSTLSDFGVMTFRNEAELISNRATLRSEGSWSTGRYYPILLIEDTEKHLTYFVEHEGGHSWEINFGTSDNQMMIETNSANFHHDAWYATLVPGEEYTTTTALVGKVEGGLEEAIKELTKAKRELSLTKWNAPLCYNVFMGGIWGEPTDWDLLPLIDACKKLGVEIFCIDAGWYRRALDVTAYNLLGDYVPNPDRFGAMKLEGVLKYMQDSGMQPGLWFEFEAVNQVMEGAQGGKKMLHRNGHVVSAPRGFYDMEDPEVREHLFKAVDRVYKMGMRFIKNDYNQNTGLGYGSSDYNEHNRRNMEAAYAFIDELRRRYPDLMIENCGSGAQRSDNGTLSHFHVQSTSDQETYFNYPTIAAGSIALMPPEKAGIWVYPYAANCAENNAILARDAHSPAVQQAVIDRNADPNITVYNMVTGQLGCMYLSGRLDLVSESNQKLIEEGIAIFKKNRDFICNAYPVYPDGFSHIGKKGFLCAGLTDENAEKLKLCVWKNAAKEDSYTIDLSKYVHEGEAVARVYPAGTKYSFDGQKLQVELSNAKYQAAFFEFE